LSVRLVKCSLHTHMAATPCNTLVSLQHPATPSFCTWLQHPATHSCRCNTLQHYPPVVGVSIFLIFLMFYSRLISTSCVCVRVCPPLKKQNKKKEIRVGTTLPRHPNVAAFIGACIHHDFPWVVFEYIGVYVCMFMCVCVYVCVCMCVHTTISHWLSSSTLVYVCVCICACVFVCVCVCVCITISKWLSSSTSVCICVCLCVCLCACLCACLCVYVVVCVDVPK